MVTGIFSQDEINFLKEYYPKYGTEYCSEKLHRNKKAVYSKVRNLKLKFTGTKYQYSKEFLEPIIKESKNFSDVIRRLGKVNSGSSQKIIVGYIKKYDFDLRHFEQDKIERINKFLEAGTIKKIPLSQILVENSTYNRTNLKERLYKEGLKQRCCEICGQDENWKGVKISLILDHKNGIHNDNRLENLQIVCPNCNAGLETHCRGHKGLKKEEFKETNIIKEVNLKQKALKRRKVERPPYEELKRLVELFGYSEIGRRYGVSDNAVRKWLKTYEKHGY